MKYIKHIFKSKIPIFYGKVIVVFTNDFIASAHDIGVEIRADSNTFGGICFKKGKDSYVIVLTLNPTWDIIAHEALHAVNYILEDRGIQVTTSNDEAQAYLLSWVIKQVLKARKLAKI